MDSTETTFYMQIHFTYENKDLVLRSIINEQEQ